MATRQSRCPGSSAPRAARRRRLKASHYTHIIVTAAQTPLHEHDDIAHAMPSHNVLTPGSPSPLRPRNPPNCATSRTTVFSAGTSLGGFFLFSTYAACHSSFSNSSCVGNCGSYRPSRISRLIRQATTRYNASAVSCARYCPVARLRFCSPL